MERYLQNVIAVRDACPASLEFPSLPESMSGLTYEGANHIETVLTLVYQVVSDPGATHNCVLGDFILGKCTLGKSEV
jgi:hypothetical protein